MTKLAIPLASPPSPAPPAEDADDEDDYMSMTIPDPPILLQKETYTQRRLRKAREVEAKQPRSKAELKAQEAAARDAALSTALPADSRGARMMAKLGYTAGKALGAEGNVGARVEPLGVEVKEGRGGVGLDGERKRKIREEFEGVEKRARVEEGEYRERIAREREEKRIEGLWWGAMKVLEGFEEPDEEEAAVKAAPTKSELKKRRRRVNVLYRELVREREEKERERRARADLLQSLSRDNNYEDPEEDKHDRLAFGREEVDGDEGEDEELENYLKEEPNERLARVVGELRRKWCYCFWCKYRYESEQLEGCPGPKEEDHD